MDNGPFVFILALIGNFILIFGLGFLVGGESPEFTILSIISVQFSFVVVMLFKILNKLKKLEGKSKD
ncbi:hypothetical protein [Bacillus sp. 7884-1]|uniref:hypothetical protein n=1 Tax=Bacillus sp. 7884-1 TaxID=2021693 RepID=UPI000BA61A01|nr:hypothetical protein [Bacillus sp. 7884-1]PAE39013.1 hypothetical protein CHI06_17435 [Bacillus sp. 7884-1]